MTDQSKKRLIGEVVSNKMQKTVVVKVSSVKRHAKYKKQFHTSKKFKAHAPEQYEMGAIVEIEETRPLSHEKRWTVIRQVK